VEHLRLRRSLFRVGKSLPLIGHIAFGLIDRGLNLLQVRPTSLCPLSCIFCSVDAGPASRTRMTEYIVDLDHLVSWFKQVSAFKGVRVQAHIDSAGDPLTYPRIVELVAKLKREASVVSLETHGALLTEDLATKLCDAGLDRLNLSIDSLNPELAKKLAGAPWFNVSKVLDIARYVASSLETDLIITPVWVPGLNDSEIPRIIEFALEIGAGKKWPPLGIQKYEAHKYGRKPKGVKPQSWREFYEALRKWEDEYGVKLILSPEDFGIRKAKKVPYQYKLHEVTRVRVVGPGWHAGQWLAVGRNRIMTIVGVEGPPPVGRGLRVKVLRIKDNIYISEPF